MKRLLCYPSVQLLLLPDKKGSVFLSFSSVASFFLVGVIGRVFNL